MNVCKSNTNPTPRAADLAIRFAIRLSADAERVLKPEMTPPAYYQALREAHLEVDARKFLAASMPKRRALWWGCLCAWDGLRGKASMQESAALEAVTAYIHHPSDELRRATREARRGARKASPAFTLASAAFFSAGSISTPGGQPVAAPGHLTGRLVGVTVYLAAAVREPRRYRDHLRHYLTLGEEIARGQHLWNAAAARVVSPVADAASVGELSSGRNPRVRRPHMPKLAASATGDAVAAGCRCRQHELQEA
jgi:hypothetical protein